MRHTPNRNDINIDPIEQGRIGKQVQLEDVSGSKSDAQGLDTPSGCIGKRPIEVLDEHQPHYRMRKPGNQDRPNRQHDTRHEHFESQ